MIFPGISDASHSAIPPQRLEIAVLQAIAVGLKSRFFKEELVRVSLTAPLAIRGERTLVNPVINPYRGPRSINSGNKFCRSGHAPAQDSKSVNSCMQGKVHCMHELTGWKCGRRKLEKCGGISGLASRVAVSEREWSSRGLRSPACRSAAHRVRAAGAVSRRGTGASRAASPACRVRSRWPGA